MQIKAGLGEYKLRFGTGERETQTRHFRKQLSLISFVVHVNEQ